MRDISVVERVCVALDVDGAVDEASDLGL